MPYATTHDIDIYYESHGAGPAVVFVHGGNGNSLSWFNQIPHFSKRRRCISVDLRNFKLSRCTMEHYHPRHFPADMLAVLDHAGVSRASFVCQSLGAWAGLPLAVRHPERVQSLVISSSPSPAWSEQNKAQLIASGVVSMAAWRGELSQTRSIGLSERFMAEQPALTFLYGSLGRLNGPKALDLMSDESVRLHPSDFAGYSVPTLVTGGAHDHFLTPTHHEHVASLIPGASCHTFAASGHSAYFEEPAEYNRVIEAFLDQS